jgi:hypothetical protein
MPDGRRCKKGGRMKQLYRRFNGLPQTTGGGRWAKGGEFYIQSVTDEGVVFLNRIKKVLFKGVSEVYRLTTRSGKTLDATADHEFLTDTGYRPLSTIKEGDLVFTNPGKVRPSGRTVRTWRKEVSVKYHPHGSEHVVLEGYVYYRIKEYHAVYEAHKNNMTLKEYVRVLNTASREEIEKLWFIPDGYEIHHIDEDFTNNELSNLRLVTPEEHGALHAEAAKEHIKIYVEPEVVESIRSVGNSKVYDIVCEDPYRNFVAGGVVVHNCGKTTLAEALAIAKKYVYSKSTIRGFHSGYKSDKEGSEDHSLIPKINNKTFIIKDGDTLMRAPNCAQILSEARDLFDGTSRAHYRHGINRDYENIRTTIILCGTGGLRELDANELGARFIICKIMEGIDETLEKNVNRKVLERALRNVRVIGNGAPETRRDPAMVKSMQLSGGYVEYLRQNAASLLDRVVVSEQQGERIICFGEFVAFMRARPSKKQDEVVEREFSSRLVEQYARLTICLAAVVNDWNVSDVTMDRVRQVALDTAQGKTLDLTACLYREGDKGATSASLAVWCGEEEDKIRKLLRFLRKIGAVEKLEVGGGNWPAHLVKTGIARYRLTARLHKLYEEVTGVSHAEQAKAT